MDKYEVLKRNIPIWYKKGLWSAAMVQDAVTKGVLTEDEANNILGKEE